MTFNQLLPTFVCALIAVSAVRGQDDGNDFRNDPLEQSRDCLETVHHGFRKRITIDAQRKLGAIMGDVSDAEEKRISPKETGSVLRHFNLVLKRTEHEVMKNRSFSAEDKTQIKAFFKQLKTCVYVSKA